MRRDSEYPCRLYAALRAGHGDCVPLCRRDVRPSLEAFISWLPVPPPRALPCCLLFLLSVLGLPSVTPFVLSLPLLCAPARICSSPLAERPMFIVGRMPSTSLPFSVLGPFSPPPIGLASASHGFWCCVCLRRAGYCSLPRGGGRHAAVCAAVSPRSPAVSFYFQSIPLAGSPLSAPPCLARCFRLRRRRLCDPARYRRLLARDPAATRPSTPVLRPSRLYR